MENLQSLSEQYFNDVYRGHDDPWSFETSVYEKAKYKATVEALPRASYRSAFEIGCSIGVLSEGLAPRCVQLLSVDVSELPLQKARMRLEKLPQVRVEKMQVPDEFPDQLFDLVVLSEVGYYWAEKDLQRARQLIVDHLEPRGQLLLVHWTPFVPDYPLTGDQVHESFLACSGGEQPLQHLHGRREEKYRLDLFEKK